MLSHLHHRPNAVAVLSGSDAYPQLIGEVRFYQLADSVLIAAEVSGLPMADAPCSESFFGFHIHSGTACSGNEEDPFADVQGHYNPGDCAHPHHAGDLPPLLGVEGNAFSAFLTDRFALRDVIGRTVIIHAMPDDFMTQPAGNAGMKIACGVIGRI
ncbi:MAG: superoxide dismutase family protein [Clostridia bacterium]|nr:superoxide dismutase family protein [Clostridia bacterium]